MDRNLCAIPHPKQGERVVRKKKKKRKKKREKRIGGKYHKRSH